MFKLIGCPSSLFTCHWLQAAEALAAAKEALDALLGRQHEAAAAAAAAEAAAAASQAEAERAASAAREQRAELERLSAERERLVAENAGLAAADIVAARAALKLRDGVRAAPESPACVRALLP